MTSNGVHHEEVSSNPVRSFRGANGNKIALQEKRTPTSNTETNGVIEFELYNDSPCETFLNLLLLCLTLLFWCTISNPIPTFASLIALALQCHRLVTSVTVDTVLVIESVGVQIIGKRKCTTFNSSQFLPWNTVHDIFINEVIIGQKVLYYLTFMVKESIGGKEKVRLVPLFEELVPERKCLEYIGAKDFPYEKELMNIIRRVIKCLPCQGQQFSTRHLLVTFNHTFWTSQDKMYAMHKFRDKPIAAPSPRAFVLTINITMSHTNINSVDAKDKRSSLRLRNKNLESQILQCASVTKASSKSVRLNTNRTVVVLDDDDNVDNRPNCETSTISKSLGNDGANRNDIFAKSDALPISQELLPITPNMKSEDHTSKNNTVPIDTKTKDTEVELEIDSMDVDSNSKESLNTTEGSEQSLLDTMKESAIESTNLLHRHPNDNDNSYCSNSSLISNSPMKLDSQIEIQENTPLSANVVNHLAFAEEEEDEDFELKVDPADAPPRSADITDLVMEGVMFTIRQDRDSVTVMEQKTKLEMDEVLENSEKVENREGEECLLNSSLLKLENLITKIEMPVSEEQREVGWTGFTQCSPAIRRVDIPSKETNLPIDYGHNRKHYSTSRMFENMDVDSNKSTTGTSASEESETESTDDGTDDTEIHKEDEHDSITSEEDSVLPSITLNERGIRTAEVIQLKARKKSDHSFLKKSDEFDFSYHNRTASEKMISKSPMINNGMACTPVANQFFVNSQKNLHTNSFSNRDSQLSDPKPHRLIDLITSNENKCLSNKVFSGPRMISNTVLTNEQIPPALRNVIRKKTEKQEGNKRLSAEMTNTKNSEGTCENSPSSTDDDLSNHKLHSSNVNNTVQRTDKDTEKAVQTSLLEDQLKTTITTPVTGSTTSSSELKIDIEALVNKISGTMHPVNMRTNVNCAKRKTNSLSKRSLRQRECPMKSSRINASDNREFFIDMRKLVQDITRGVKVVVNRIPITDKTVYKKCTPDQKS